MQTITSSHFRTNNPPTISNGYKNWWDVAGQNPQQLQLTPINITAPSYGQHQSNINQFLPLTPINTLPKLTLNKGCGCQGAK